MVGRSSVQSGVIRQIVFSIDVLNETVGEDEAINCKNGLGIR